MLGRCLGQVVGRAVARETDNEAPVFIASPHTLDSCLWLMHETAGIERVRIPSMKSHSHMHTTTQTVNNPSQPIRPCSSIRAILRLDSRHPSKILTSSAFLALNTHSNLFLRRVYPHHYYHPYRATAAATALNQSLNL